MRFRIPIVIAFIAFLSNCSTGPDFNRDNPYDRNPEKDSLGLEQFPLANPDKYIFTNAGLKVNMNKNYDQLGKNLIFRKNGNSEFELIDSAIVYSLYSSHPPDYDGYYLDKEVTKVEDIGFPLIYKLQSVSSGKANIIEIEFGKIEPINLSTSPEKIIISWQDSVFLNEGFDIYKKYNDQTTLIKEVEVPDSYFSLPFNQENLKSEFFISPFKKHEGEKTHLDATYYSPVPSQPTNFSFSFFNSKNIQLSWNDNSNFETGFKVIDHSTNKEFKLPANQESLIIQKVVSPYDNLSFSVKSLFHGKESNSVNIDTTILDYPYPTILDIEHKDENTFLIYFEDPVSFDRQIYFKNSIENTQFIANSSDGFAEISISTGNKSLDINFSADLSYGRYGFKHIPISKRAALKILDVHDLSIDTNPDKIDMRTVGESLIYSQENVIYKLDLNSENLQSRPIISLPENINLLRMSNDNSTAFAHTVDSNSFLINLFNESAVAIDNIPKIVHDISFIENDTKIAISSQYGLVVYSLDTNSYSYLESFDSKAELEFIGDATQTRLLGLDRANDKIHYFNTLHNFGFHNTAIIDKHAINGYLSEVTNVSHLNSDNNVVGYQIGGALEFRINDPDCYANKFSCPYGVYDSYENDRNTYVQILDLEFRLIFSENYLRIVDKHNLFNIHVINRDHSEVSMLKVNHDANIAVEFHDDSKELYFYDISEKWSFTNYGVYFDLVWPSN